MTQEERKRLIARLKMRALVNTKGNDDNDFKKGARAVLIGILSNEDSIESAVRDAAMMYSQVV